MEHGTGLGIRLGRAIDRWSGGGQRAFVTALKKHAENSGLSIPTSYRTLQNYLSERTHPGAAWVHAAAAVLRWNPEHLLTGEGPERPGGTLDGLTMQSWGTERGSFLLHHIRRRDHELPLGARLMLLRFLDDHFGDDLEGWPIPDARRANEVDAVLIAFYGPLFARPRTSYTDTMALAASLTAAAYVRLGANRASSTQREED